MCEPAPQDRVGPCVEVGKGQASPPGIQGDGSGGTVPTGENSLRSSSPQSARSSPREGKEDVLYLHDSRLFFKQVRKIKNISRSYCWK